MAFSHIGIPAFTDESDQRGLRSEVARTYRLIEESQDRRRRLTATLARVKGNLVGARQAKTPQVAHAMLTEVAGYSQDAAAQLHEGVVDALDRQAQLRRSAVAAAKAREEYLGLISARQSDVAAGTAAGAGAARMEKAALARATSANKDLFAELRGVVDADDAPYLIDLYDVAATTNGVVRAAGAEAKEMVAPDVMPQDAISFRRWELRHEHQATRQREMIDADFALPNLDLLDQVRTLFEPYAEPRDADLDERRAQEAAQRLAERRPAPAPAGPGELFAEPRDADLDERRAQEAAQRLAERRPAPAADPGRLPTTGTDPEFGRAVEPGREEVRTLADLPALDPTGRERMREEMRRMIDAAERSRLDAMQVATPEEAAEQMNTADDVAQIANFTVGLPRAPEIPTEPPPTEGTAAPPEPEPEPEPTPEPESVEYTVQPGDTLSQIAAQHGTTAEDLAERNAIENPDMIHPGQVLQVGGAAEPTAAEGEGWVPRAARAVFRALPPAIQGVLRSVRDSPAVQRFFQNRFDGTRGDSGESRGLRNNNPGNIRHGSSRWDGMEPDQTQDAAFVQFKLPEYGIQAMSELFDTYHRRYGLDTIGEVITRWAPPKAWNRTTERWEDENDTGAYIKSVMRSLGHDTQGFNPRFVLTGDGPEHERTWRLVNETDTTAAFDSRDLDTMKPFLEAVILHENGSQPLDSTQIYVGMAMAREGEQFPDVLENFLPFVA